MSRTGLFISPLRDGPHINAGITYVDNCGGEWSATAVTSVFSDGLYVACIDRATGAAGYFRQIDGAGFACPTAPNLQPAELRSGRHILSLSADVLSP